MIKIFTFRKIAITSLLFLLALILYNYPEEINENVIIENNNKMNIYLIDDNNLVSMTKINYNSTKTDERIKEIISALTIGGSVLPQGFEAVLPKGTNLIDFELKNGLLKLNFTRDILSVSHESEEKMLEALIYSLTDLSEVKNIMIFVENEILNELPNSHKKINLYLNRDYGINKVVDITTFKNTQMVTIYYLNKNDDYYYTPVSYILNNTNDKIEIIINNLKSNKFNNSNLLSHLDYQVELMNYEAEVDYFLLNFNEVLLDSVSDGVLKEEVKYAISYSVFDTFGVKEVIFQVNSEEIDKFILEN